MDLRDHLVRMAQNNAWANLRLHAAVSQLPVAAFRLARTSFFPSLAETLNHILEVDLYYLDALEEGGKGRRVFDRFLPHETMATLRSAQTEADRRLVRFCAGLTPTDLDRSVATDRGDQGMIREPIPSLLEHLFQHQIHHRGQAHAMLAGTHIPPPQLDEFFLEFDKPVRAKEMAELGFKEPG
jgi:uncharacterized damage-inducible protein DinB